MDWSCLLLLLLLRCPLGGEITGFADLHTALHEAIVAQLEADGNGEVAGEMASHRLELEYLASLQNAPEGVSEASCDLGVLRAAKAIKVTLVKESLLD